MCNIYIYVNGEPATAVAAPPTPPLPPPTPPQPQPAEVVKPKPSPLQSRFKILASMLDDDEPTKRKILRVITPLIEALESGEPIADGLFDILSTPARKSVMMLFLLHMLRDAEELEKPAPPRDFPDKVPLDVSDGDNIPEEVIDGQVPYSQAAAGKLDKGF